MKKGDRYIEAPFRVGFDGSVVPMSMDEFMWRLPVSMRQRIVDVSVGMKVMVYSEAGFEYDFREGRKYRKPYEGRLSVESVTEVRKTVYKTYSDHCFNPCGLASAYDRRALCFRMDSEAAGFFFLYMKILRVLKSIGSYGKEVGLETKAMSDLLVLVSRRSNAVGLIV